MGERRCFAVGPDGARKEVPCGTCVGVGGWVGVGAWVRGCGCGCGCVCVCSNKDR